MSQHEVAIDDEQSNHEDPETLDALFSYPFPEELNQIRIREMFGMFQSQDRDDLTEELKTILKYTKAKVIYFQKLVLIVQNFSSDISLGCRC